MRFCIIIFAGLLSICPITLKAQLQLSAYGLGQFPSGTFGASGYRNGTGFGVELLSDNAFAIYTDSSLVQLRGGLAASYSWFGTKKFELELAEPENTMADVKIANTAFAITPTIRASFGRKKLKPYSDAFVGINVFSTTQTITPQYQRTGYEAKTENDLSSALAFYFGIGSGILIELSEAVNVNLGIGYAYGNRAEVIPLNSLEKVGNEIKYRLLTLPTDMAFIRFGFTFDLQPQKLENSSNTDDGQKPEKPNILKKNTPVIGY